MSCSFSAFLPPLILDKSSSRKAFREIYRDAPQTNSALETQQDALLRQQEATLRAIREGRKYFIIISVEPVSTKRVHMCPSKT